MPVKLLQELNCSNQGKLTSISKAFQFSHELPGIHPQALTFVICCF